MNSALGKRKEREDDLEPHGSTLFVSNLPYTATSVDLQTLFSDIAPVRSAFVVTEPGTGNSKGVGYVSFSIREDAQTAFDTLSEQGIALSSRKLRIQWAENKPKLKTEKVQSEVKPTRRHKTHPKIPRDPNAIRTIAISGLPSGIDSKALWKKVRKHPGAEKVEFPVEGEGSDVARVQFSSPAEALDAVSKLHAHVFKGSLLSVALKKRLDHLSKPTTSKSASSVAPSHSSRLIVRNIPFNTSEKDLRAIFLPHGPVYSVHIPRFEDGKMKGFAFVWMLSRKDAERAMEKCNGMKMHAGMVEDVQKKKKTRREEEKGKKLEREERTIAIDWALSKDRWQEEKAKMQVDEDVDASEGEGGGESESSSSSNSSGSGNESEDEVGLHHEKDESLSEDGSDADEDEHSDAPAKPQLPAPETGNTLFIRNVPFQATEDELRALFRAYGPLRYARITLDPATGRSRGTGFACFWNKEDADKVVEQSDLLRLETTGQASEATTPQPKKNPFSMPSILTPDPSSTLAQSLVLHGRTLDCVRAVTRDEADKLREEGERRREKADKRNMYLLREGVILPNSPAAQTLPEAELERRTNSFNARRQLLKTNPSLYISKTRLSIRQIPLFVTERMLKRLATHAVAAFKADVKAKTRSELSADELREEHSDGGKTKGVKQAKIVRQADRIDLVTGKGRSRGYGFLEMYSHADALRVLRWANNNPSFSRLFEEWRKDEVKDLITKEKGKDEDRVKRLRSELEDRAAGKRKQTKGTLIVEFSIENVQVVQRRSTIQKIRAQRAEKEGETAERPAKKARTVENEAENTAPSATLKLGQKVGAIIGRKRKQRKAP